MTICDILIVGGGIAGASLAAELGHEAQVVLIEMESHPGYHATGRSVAFWEESYGGKGVQPLTSASGPLLRDPDPAFSDQSFLTPRGAIHIGRQESAATRDRMLAQFAATDVTFQPLDAANLQARIEGLRPDWTVGLAEPSWADIDVGALHGAYLRAFRSYGGRVLTDTRMLSARREGHGWEVETNAGVIGCRIIVDAAGAWADEVAGICGVRPIGITPYRRTVIQLRVDPPQPADLPVIMDLEGRFYFKPEGPGRLWLSPHDETPSDPCDAAPEELAVAQAIDQFEQAVSWRIEAVERKWAGLRSFAPDRLPVYGFDKGVPGFFWFAGQGGFGIQTAPAAARIGAALLTGSEPDPAVAMIDPSPFSPERFS